ncbi:MAG: hypothetical protein IPO04_04455 [Cytophagaceae bacterium]|nr:hypothetical protein [Cytophagaceae bacterium]
MKTKEYFSKEVVIENSNDLVDNSKYQSMFPYTGVFSKPLSVETSGAGIIRYEINDIKGATYPTESKPRISISENEISLAYWIDQKNEKYNIKERVYFAPKPIKSQISKKSILNISPKFISAHLIINNELINIFESYGNWKIFSFSKNRLNAEYDGLFRSDDGTNYKVKIKLENLFFSIEP